MEYASLAVGGALVGALGSILNRIAALLESRERRQDRRLALEHGLTAVPPPPPEGGPECAAPWPWVAAVRALTRPALTLLLWLLFTGLFLTAVLGGPDRATAAKVVSTALDTVAFAASTAMAWWFGDRAPRRTG